MINESMIRWGNFRFTSTICRTFHRRGVTQKAVMPPWLQSALPSHLERLENWWQSHENRWDKMLKFLVNRVMLVVRCFCRLQQLGNTFVISQRKQHSHNGRSGIMENRSENLRSQTLRNPAVIAEAYLSSKDFWRFGVMTNPDYKGNIKQGILLKIARHHSNY